MNEKRKNNRQKNKKTKYSTIIVDHYDKRLHEKEVTQSE